MTRACARRATCLAVCLVAAAAGAAAQTRPGVAPPPAAAETRARTSPATAAEDFELDIAERRITETDFQAATEVAAGDAAAGGLDLRVGAHVRAAQVDLVLRNVRGRVRFRASLAPVLRVLDARRGQR